MLLSIRRTLTIVDETQATGRDGGGPLRKVAVVTILKDPLAGQFGEDLSSLTEASAELGRVMGETAMAAMRPYPVASYGKGGVTGLNSDAEHLAALVTTVFAAPIRATIGGGAAWVPSFAKRAAPGATIDIPLAHKDALYVRSHYDGMSITIPDGPMPDEIAVVLCLANRGRIDARVGGLRAEDIVGKDGLT